MNRKYLRQARSNWMAQQVQNLFKFKNFYDQVDFDACQHLAIKKAIIDLMGSLGGSSLVQNRPCGGRKSEDSAVIFCKNIGSLT